MCSRLRSAGLIGVPAGSSGPLILLNSPLFCSCSDACCAGCGSAQTGLLKVKRTPVGLAAESGKYLASAALPAAESVPAGAEAVAPNPPGL